MRENTSQMIRRRIISHCGVYLRCFFPDQRLEDSLQLERRIRAKLTTDPRTVGVESEVILGADAVEVVFADEREEIERLRACYEL